MNYLPLMEEEFFSANFDKFYETDYIKKSKGGIMGHKCQNLKDILGLDKLPDDKKIAELLKEKD